MSKQTRDATCLEFRTFEIRKDGDSDEIRGILTTEQPVKMFDWERGEVVDEVLLMSGMKARGDSVRLLDTHNTWSVDAIKGSFDDIKTHGKKDARADFPYVDGRLSFDPSEAQVESKVRNGHITEMSVGYRIDRDKTVFIASGEQAEVKGRTFTGPVNVRTEWTLNEASLVPIGADDQAQIKGFRSMQDAAEQLGKTAKRDDAAGGVEPGGSDPATPGGVASDGGDGTPPTETKERTKKMSVEITDEPPKLTAEQQMKLQNDAREAETTRRRELDECEKFAVAAGMSETDARGFANLYRESGETADDAMKHLRAHPEKFERAPLPTSENVVTEELGLTRQEKAGYNIAAAARFVAKQKWNLAIEKSERIAWDQCMDVSAGIEKRCGRKPKGFFFPPKLDLMTDEQRQRDYERQQRDLSAGTDTTMVGTDHLADEFIDVLRNKMLTRSLGIRVLSGLVGDVSIPRKATASSGAWFDEATTAFTESEPTFNAVTLSPEHYGLVMDLTWQFLAQGTPDTDAMAQDDMNEAIALGLDAAVLNGTGTNQPMGIENSVGVETSSLAVTTAPTLAELVEFETDVDTTNALESGMAFITTPAIRGYLRQTLATSGVSGYLWGPGGPIQDGAASAPGNILGYRAFSTNQLDGNTGSIIQFGSWREYILGTWDGMDLLIDPYTQGPNRIVRYILGVMADGDTRQPDAFCRDA